MNEIDILMDELLKDVEVNVAAEPTVTQNLCNAKGASEISNKKTSSPTLQEVTQTKPVSLGLSIRKDIFMSPKKEVIELGVSI